MTLKQIQKEINKLNTTIDKNILNGKSYKKESQQHANYYYFLKQLSCAK